MTGIETKGAQYLDTLEVERERGITIKAQSCSILYEHPADGLTYLLNLIDTPGHTDFQYEVARSLSACQGTILLVDAIQGVQAQTVANFYLAFMQQNLEVIGALNKIDVEHVDLSSSRSQLASLMDVDESEILQVSAKTGKNVDHLLQTIVERIPPPPADQSQKTEKQPALRALLLDMWFDRNRGAVLLVYLTSGRLKKGDVLELKHAQRKMTASDIGVMHPNLTPTDFLHRGQLGYITCNRNQDVRGLRVGDTISRIGETVESFPGFKPARSMVYAGVFPVTTDDSEKLEPAVQRLSLSDSSLEYRKVVSQALGTGFRCGFLGLLHMDVIKQRLKAEHDVDIILTTPTVVESVDDFPKNPLGTWEEPTVEGEVLLVRLCVGNFGTFVSPVSYASDIIQLCYNRRGFQISYELIDPTRAMFKFDLPLSEIIVDFADKILQLSHGYASFVYEHRGARETDLRKVDIKINGDPAEALSFICRQDSVREVAGKMLKRLKEHISPHAFEINLQGCVGGKVLVAEKIGKQKKNAIAKDHSVAGDPTRKMKLIKEAKEREKKLKQVGKIKIPPEAFMQVVRLD
ncbi:Translation factor guf1 mitochondrial [Perkinsus chesapeaki]|uniref:Translation factor GUF1 homolog, mitochondrial n=1 Tax=Perkinsus chesapeaki TaxID=330153 RepID=A0A7J6LAD3_PERCH|nr:Translation factor guf1 mitochondrial [Perkinsus chesapeaki]